MKRVLKWVGVSLSILAMGLVSFVLATAELRNCFYYQIDTESARDANFYLIEDPAHPGLKLYLLGTIHGQHLREEGYSLWHLRALIEHLHPDLLLVESRPEELALDHWGDGPVEMPFASLTARAAGIEVQGIDWWIPVVDGRRTNDTRDDQIYENLKSHLPEQGTVLVLIGYSHVPELVDRLTAAGCAVGELTVREKQDLFDTTETTRVFPVGYRAAIEERIALEEQLLSTLPAGAERQNQQEVIAARRALLTIIDEIGEQ